MAAITPPENEKKYPEPSMFGSIPASGFFIRHAKNVILRDIQFDFLKPDARPTLYLDDVHGIKLIRVSSTQEPQVKRLIQNNVTGLQDN